MMKLFGSAPKPEEQVKMWRQKLRSEQRQIDNQIRAIAREEEKIKKSIKEAGKKGDQTVCKILAKELIRSRKAKNRLATSKAQMNSVVMQLQEQLATLKLAGAMKKNTEIMKMVNNLVKLPELQKTMMEMSKEMMKAGIIEEMMDDAMGSLDDEDIEEEAEEEVLKVINEVTKGILDKATAVPKDAEVTPEEQEDEDDEELENMQQRLQALQAEN